MQGETFMKKEVVLVSAVSFMAGLAIGMIFTAGAGKVTINGDNNVVRTGFMSYCGNDNGRNNSLRKTK